MTSFDDASLMFGKWREDETLLDFVLADRDWLVVEARCVVAEVERFMVVLRNDSAKIMFGLVNAEFRYEDHRVPLKFIRKDIDLRDAVCAMRVSFPTGAIAMLIQRKAA